MADIEEAAHNVHSFFKKHKIRTEHSSSALKYEFNVRVHSVHINPEVKLKNPEWQWVVVWTRGAKVAATHYAKCKQTGSGYDASWQQYLSLLGTVFKEKDGSFMKKDCKFVLKQMKTDNKTHVSLGRVKLNLSEYIIVDRAETVLELRLRDSKKKAVGTMSITLSCRHLPNYSRDTGTLATGMSEVSIGSVAPTPDPDSDDEATSVGGGAGVGASAGAGASGNGAVGPGRDRDPEPKPRAVLGGREKALEDEVEELRHVIEEEHQENERLRIQVDALTKQLQERKHKSDTLARNMTKYEVELLRTAEKQARIEAEVEERLTAAFVPMIQRLEEELAQAREGNSKDSRRVSAPVTTEARRGLGRMFGK